MVKVPFDIEKGLDTIDRILYVGTKLTRTLMLPFQLIGTFAVWLVGQFFVLVISVNMRFFFVSVPAVIAVMLVISFSSILTWNFSSNIDEQWAVEGSTAIAERDSYKDIFGDTPRYVMAIYAPKGDKNNMLDADILKEIRAFEQGITQLSVDDDLYTDICYENPSTSQCLQYTITAAWANDTAIEGDTDLGGTVKTLVDAAPFLETYIGGTVTTDPSSGEYSSIGALSMMFLLKRSSESAESFEKKYVDYAEDYSTDFIDIHFYATRSVSDGANPDLPSTIAMVAASLTMMFVFTLISLGECTPIKSRLTLTVIGLSGIGLALATGLGGSLIFGSTISAIFFAIPFVVLGVGIDNTFIACSEYDRERSRYPEMITKDDVRSITKHSYRGTGPSITMTTITDTLSFMVGATSKLNAIRSFCIMAACSIVSVYCFQTFIFSFFLYLDNLRQASGRVEIFFLRYEQIDAIIQRMFARVQKRRQQLRALASPMLSRAASRAPTPPSYPQVLSPAVEEGASESEAAISVEHVDMNAELQDVETALTEDYDSEEFLTAEEEAPTAPATPVSHELEIVTSPAPRTIMGIDVFDRPFVQDIFNFWRWAKYLKVFRLQFLVGQVLAKIVTNIYVAPVIIVVFACFGAFGLYHINDLETGIAPEDVIATSSSAMDYINARDEFFASSTVEIVTEFDSSEHDMLTLSGYKQYRAMLDGMQTEWRWYMGSSRAGFVKPYEAWLPTSAYAPVLDLDGLPSNDAYLRESLVVFVGSVSQQYSADFATTPDISNAVTDPSGFISTFVVNAVKTKVDHISYNTSAAKVDYMEQTRDDFESISEQYGISAWVYDSKFMYDELDARQMQDIISNISLAMLACFVVFTIFLKSPWMSFIVVLTVFSIDCAVITVMYFLDLKLNTIAVVVLVIGIGFSADYVAHIVFGYNEANPVDNPSRGRRAEFALSVMGQPIAQGALSTFLGISMLLFSDLKSIQSIGTLLIVIILSGIIHGLAFSPAVITLIAPMAWPSDVKSKKDLPQ
ncbi:hypothetical protein J8273_4652 [Carpediemonas membranifera]|uniref:SSD domain-containing protein n=1 Tax=Carpediemonas membranifera TaxID=201153 RepID=A0A8J6DZL4_9EUKA|nr:hypothetical protein J8273_4652 [Carpediemonas membranifera]|eukprot:KAG9393789.1 hypothetical protein J8273_4652 [Carpediemonas membranifera]